MLLKITNYCEMVCSHCSENSDTNGKHMEEQVFIDSLNFINNLDYKPSVILITGGEPTAHPKFLIFMEVLRNVYKGGVIVTSNGMFFKNGTILNYLKNHKDIKVQITNDKRYYPKQIEHIYSENFYYEYNIRHVAPFGRAVTNNIPINRNSPFCFNLRSIHTKYNDFNADIMIMENMGKFCSPTIDVQGNVILGEMSSCHTVGTVYDEISTINNNIANMRCNKCKLFDQLSDLHKKTVGED